MSNRKVDLRPIPDWTGYRITRDGSMLTPRGRWAKAQYKNGAGPYYKLWNRDTQTGTEIAASRLVALAWSVKTLTKDERKDIKRDAILQEARANRNHLRVWCMANELSVQTDLGVMDSLEVIASLGMFLDHGDLRGLPAKLMEESDGRIR